MAKSFILRPSADVKVGHKITPSDSLYAYQLINESVHDGNATALIATGDEIVNLITYTSNFMLGGDIPPLNEITDVIVGMVVCTPNPDYYNLVDSHSIEISVNGISCGQKFVCSHTGEEWYLHTVTHPEAVDTINNHLKEFGEFPAISISLYSRMEGSDNLGNKSSEHDTYITQVYVEFRYISDKEIYQKNDGKYKYASVTYQKKNGTWTEIPSDEAKTIIINNTIRRG